jgi:hypothetical protein
MEAVLGLYKSSMISATRYIMMTRVYGERAVVAVKGIRLFKKVFGNDAVNVLNVQFKNKKKERKTIKQMLSMIFLLFINSSTSKSIKLIILQNIIQNYFWRQKIILKLRAFCNQMVYCILWQGNHLPQVQQ